MEKDKITSAISTYVERKDTDYAVMISGVWGSGKTYLYIEKLVSEIKSKNKRPVYISLIGVNSMELLSQKISKQINVFHDPFRKSTLADEAERIENVFNSGKAIASKESKLENIVLCFDDLERINPDFFEAAMGYINTFIEHEQVKCIFLCNEEKLQIENYKEIKEKYVRFTFYYSPMLQEIIYELAKAYENISEGIIQYILDMFKKGNCQNIRTLKAVISMLDQIFGDCEDKSESMYSHKAYIQEKITEYVCFYIIEMKNGIDKELLNKVEVGASTFNLMLDDISPRELPTVDDKDNTINSKVIENIKRKYFGGKDMFGSATSLFRSKGLIDYLVQGYLDIQSLKADIDTLHGELINDDGGKERDKFLSYVMNPANFEDSEVIPKFQETIKEVEGGLFDLKECVKIYQTLLVWQYRKLDGWKVDVEVTKSFQKGVEEYIMKSLTSPVENLRFQLNVFDSLEGVERDLYQKFKEYVILRNSAIGKVVSSNFKEEVVCAIEKKDPERIGQLFREGAILNIEPEYARKIFDALMLTNAVSIDSFRVALIERYANTSLGDSSYSVNNLAEVERGFITELHSLLKNEPELEDDKSKSISKLSLYVLKNELDKIIRERNIGEKK